MDLVLVITLIVMFVRLGKQYGPECRRVGLRKSGHGFHRYDVGRCCRRRSHPLWHSPRLAWPVAWGLGRAVRATEFIRQNPGPRDEGDARRPSSRDVPFFAVTLRSVEKPELALRTTALERLFPAARVSGGVPLAKAYCRQSVAATGGELRK